MLYATVSRLIQRLNPFSVRTLMTCSHYQPTKSTLLNNTCHQIGMGSSLKPDNLWSFDLVRTNIRNNFPRPRESKRVKTHGFKKRMATPGGRAILMRRILKGRHVLSH
ncbi:mitochondrial ribosomal protein L34 [Lycorma delicatula]|uniref:mitochondrial ribosomal protein L34 n=1 Tax=Lycorma delicatula TaxID=130591 RepID=UPI003F511015